MIAVCKVPKDSYEAFYAVMVKNAGAVPASRLDELLDLIPAEKNEWMEDLDHTAIKHAREVFGFSANMFAALGYPNANGAERSEELAVAMEEIEVAAKQSWLAKYLRNRLRRLVEPLFMTVENPAPVDAECRDLDSSSKWRFILATEESEDYGDVLLLDASHICRVDLHMEMADLLSDEFQGEAHSDRIYETATDYFCSAASDICNGGLREVIYALLNEGWTETDIRMKLEP
jgi:hypothetical protein